MSSTSKGVFDLSAKRRALLEALLSEQGINSPAAERIPRRTDRGPAPLSFAQQRLWFFDQFEPGSSLYNLMAPVLFEGELDADALEKAFNQIVGRHEALRTAFDFRDGLPVQVVAAVQPVKMARIDLAGLEDDEQQRRMQSLLREEAGRPFDLKRGPLLRITLL